MKEGVTFDHLDFLAISAFLAISPASSSSVPPRFRSVGSFRLCHKLSRFNFPRSFYLHKNAVVARLWKAIRERNFC